MFGKALAPLLVELNLVPDADARGGAYLGGERKTPSPEQRALRFLDNMGRYGLLPRSVSPGYPAWTLHAAAEICAQREYGQPYKEIRLPKDFDPGRLLNDLGLTINYCSKLVTGPKQLKPMVVKIRDEGRGWTGVTEPLIAWIENEILTVTGKFDLLDPWDAFEQFSELRHCVLDKHEQVMRRKGWLVPPAARPT